MIGATTLGRRWYMRALPRGSRQQTLSRRQIIIGDAKEQLARLPEGCVDAVVTSPPYFLLRDYGVGGQIGLEESVDDYVERLVSVIDEIPRVLKAGGSLWLDLGDSYSRHAKYGAPPKSLLLAPERVVFALVERGWILRNKICWAKANSMPTSVADRLSTTHEFVYHLVRQPKYYYNLNAIREPHRSAKRSRLTTKTRREKESNSPGRQKYDGTRRAWAGPLAGSNSGLAKVRAEGRVGHVLGKNPGDVWRLSASRFAGAHFATFPEELVTRPILATCPKRICVRCGEPWRRTARQSRLYRRAVPPTDRRVLRYSANYEVLRRLGPLKPQCKCKAAWRPGVVLDPFMGAGTTAIVAERLGRDWVGIELNPEFKKLAEERIADARSSGDAPRPERR